MNNAELISRTADMLSAVAAMQGASTPGKWRMVLNQEAPGFGSIIAVNDEGEERLIAQGIDMDCSFAASAHNNILKILDVFWVFVQEANHGNIPLTPAIEAALKVLTTSP